MGITRSSSTISSSNFTQPTHAVAKWEEALVGAHHPTPVCPQWAKVTSALLVLDQDRWVVVPNKQACPDICPILKTLSNTQTNKYWNFALCRLKAAKASAKMNSIWITIGTWLWNTTRQIWRKYINTKIKWK